MTDIDLTLYPEGSICREMVVDIFADPRSGEISILHDRPFSIPVQALVFDGVRRRLGFVMADGRTRDFGVEIVASLAGPLCAARNVALFEVERQVRQVRNQVIVPLSQAPGAGGT